jgi:hypothetical protein
MHKCPWCNGAAVSGIAVRWSSRSSPASCASCGKLSHVLASTSSGIFSVGIVLLCCVLFAAFLAQSYLVGIAGVGLVVAYNVWAWRKAELFPISSDSANAAAQVTWWVVALSLLANIFS